MMTDAHWQRVGTQPHHGVLVPLFALHSQHGGGEFLDLEPLIDWCASLGLDVIQLLPLNDTGEELSPYYACSSCALDPVYLSLGALPDAGAVPQLGELPRLQVKRAKRAWLRSYFEQHFASMQPDVERFSAQHPWLLPYARFKAAKGEGDIDFHRFVQFLAFQQMARVRAYATKRGVLLKGDLPILLSPDSADVWAEPELFDLTHSAGAPPDVYNARGQNWGFPLFRWDVMRQQNYRWWKRRLSAMQSLYHLYRIDHVVGYFRIWAIEPGALPSEGHFIPPDPTLWLAQGRELLTMMAGASPLLPMAEDLGTIPKGVDQVLRELGICSTKVLLWQQRQGNVIPYDAYDPLSLTTISTSDGEPLALQWRNAPELVEPFVRSKRWKYAPELTREQRLALLRDAHHTSSRFHISLLQEYLALFPELSWPQPENDRINVPGTVLPTNWTYRFRPSIEEIAAHAGLAAAMRTIIGSGAGSGR